MTTDWEALRQKYPITKDKVYFMNASISGIHLDVKAEINKWILFEIEQAACHDEKYFEELVRTRNEVGSYLQTKTDNIALTTSTSHNMNLLALMLSKDLKQKNQIILPEIEFPSAVLPWYHHGFEVIRIPLDKNGRLNQGELLSSINHKTAAVVISMVQFQTGQRIDPQKLGEMCSKANVPFILNATQALGAFSIEPEKWKVSALSASCHKWLGAGIGQAVLYLSEIFRKNKKWPMIGWTSVTDPWQLSTKPPLLRSDVGVLELGSLPFPLMAGVKKAMQISREIGLKNISERILTLSDKLEKQLRLQGATIDSPRESNKEKSGILSFNFQNQDSELLSKKLKEKNIFVNCRRGNLRASLHFYNNEEDINHFSQVIRDIL